MQRLQQPHRGCLGVWGCPGMPAHGLHPAWLRLAATKACLLPLAECCDGRRPSNAVVPVQRLRSQLGMEGLVLQPADGWGE